MTDDRTNEPRSAPGDAEAPAPEAGTGATAGGVPWSNLWQVPTIILSVILIAIAFMMPSGEEPGDIFENQLARAEEMVDQRLLDEAEPLIREEIEPNLEQADEKQRGRFHQLVADWVALSQQAEAVDRPSNHERIVAQYRLAQEHAITLTPARLERLGNALVSLERLDEAQRILAALEALDDGRKGEVYDRRGRLFRRIVEQRIARAEAADHDELMAVLRTYRAERAEHIDDLAWAIARQAEMRLRRDDPHAAVDRLMVDLRRIEYVVEQTGADAPQLGELYTLLGRGYYELGEYEQAQFNLNRALEQFASDDPVRGEALVLLGRIAFARGELELASDRFDEVSRNFIATPSYLPGVLGKAQVNSVLGYHDESQREYRRLAGMREQIDAHPRITREIIAGSLIDRHDAALATGNLELALGYARLAEEFFARPNVPTDVLTRVAATSRQLADDLREASQQAVASGDAEAQEHALTLQREANRKYQQAGEYFIRHARRLAGLPDDDEAWSRSLWLGAESYDRGGLHELAIRHLEEYLAGRSPQDPRRAEVSLRLAMAHHALQNYEDAVRYYSQVIDEHPRSMEATKSYVPRARALVMLGRRSEAEQLLTSVIAGTRPIQPDAEDYRDALMELGRIQYHGGNYRKAIERLEEAVKRYPDDDRHTDLLFKLGDSYRRLAMRIVDRVREPSAESPGEQRRLNELKSDHYDRAFDLFDEVCRTYGRRDQRTLERMQRDALRASFLYRADCAYALGRYEQAIQLYDQAARRYADHHSSMHALVQIVNTYAAIGDTDRAEAAHRRALTRLQQLRDEAFEADDSLMDRQAWERWLEHTPVGSRQMTRAPGPG